MLLDVHADELEQTARNTARLPPPPKQTDRFSVWSTATAVPRGVTVAAAETTGFWSDIVGAFGDVGGAYPEMFGAIPDAAMRKQADEARRKLLTEGVSYSSEAGDLFRGVEHTYRPDPQTAHTAERLVFDFARFATKAVGYSLAAGPVVGSLLTGADEGMAAADDLRQQGVDEATRTAAGAVAGVTSALGVALPVYGKTVAQTAALVAMGGPLSFIGQQAATGYILERAGHDKIADQYDPFDPVGLAVSTLVPAGFGAWALRRARAPVGDAAEPELVDAARVRTLVEEQRRAHVAPDAVADAEVAIIRSAADEIDAGPPPMRSEPEADAARAAVAEDEPSLLPRSVVRVAEATKAGPSGVAEPVAATLRTEDGLVFSVEREFRGKYVMRDADGQTIGSVIYTDAPAGKYRVTGVEVRPDMRRQGVASAVYDFLESTVIRQPFEASGAQSEAGAAFRAARKARADDATQPAKTAAAVRVDPLAAIEAEMPGLRVRLDDMDSAAPMREVLERAKAEAERDTADSALLKVAADCAIGLGA